MAFKKHNIPNTPITFGAPRVGDPKFAQFAETIMPGFLRVCYIEDWAQHVNKFEHGYMHSGPEVLIDKGGKITKNHASGEVKRPETHKEGDGTATHFNPYEDYTK